MQNRPPLEGLKILDLSRVLAGPFCTQTLGDLGAEVIKVEHPDGGDDTRHWGPPYFEGVAAYYLSANRNKKSIALDFEKSADIERVYELVRDADVLIENFKVGSLKKFKLDYDACSKLNPRLIYCSITGFGQTGPRAQEPGYDFMIQAMSGFMSVTGPDQKHPFKAGVAIADICTGLYASTAILAALREREKSGLGQHCDLSLLDSQVSVLSYLAMNFLTTGHAPEALGNRHPSITPYQSFETQDRPLVICIGNDHQFENFSRRLRKHWHEDSKFLSNEKRNENREELCTLIQAELKQNTLKHWEKEFQGAGFPFTPILNLAELSKDAQVQSRKIFTKMDDQKTPAIASPLRFSRSTLESYRRPPKLGENQNARFGDKN